MVCSVVLEIWQIPAMGGPGKQRSMTLCPVHIPQNTNIADSFVTINGFLFQYGYRSIWKSNLRFEMLNTDERIQTELNIHSLAPGNRNTI